jgi:hypothetical protein
MGGLSDFLSQDPLAHAIERVGDPLRRDIANIASGGGGGSGGSSDPSSGTDTSLLEHPQAEEASAKQYAAKQKANAAQKAREQQYESEIKQITTNPWATAADTLASSFTKDLAAVGADVSGTSAPGAQAGAASSALASLGLSPQSPAAQWLNSQTAAAQATAAPVAGAMNAESQTYANAAGPISAAITQWGQDNAISEITAPEQAWLSALASHVTSNLSYQGQVPTADVPSIPTPVAQALQKSGGYPGSTAAGLTALQNIVPGGGGTSTVGTSSSALTGAGAPGIVAPTSNPAPGQ